jgi:hypothetical protein
MIHGGEKIISLVFILSIFMGTASNIKPQGKKGVSAQQFNDN